MDSGSIHTMRELHHPPTSDLNLTSVLAALADPVRLRAVCELAARGELSSGECSASCAGGTAKSTMSHHFRVLREAGLTRTRVEGAHRYVTLRRADLDTRFPGLLDAVLTNLHTTTPK